MAEMQDSLTQDVIKILKLCDTFVIARRRHELYTNSKLELLFHLQFFYLSHLAYPDKIANTVKIVLLVNNLPFNTLKCQYL